ncbi:glycoside hydrolase family 18 protein [Trichoderma citrinoviride]|uniref:Glycoside hydrolase family 18 protein n=1 Tax=Trichoderma citrinoviride TaxID=58853 RepID=A0A2T4BKV8_9HYPO|nr:glycoside hydrolase family 18 protein [Trichoderma citrinoviride]PTB69952.1 glycoside hydrolase family 18 protein [Trichoderma citrinoviride]
MPPAKSGGICDTKSVFGLDSCSSMAQKCGLKVADFTSLHSHDKRFCSSLAVGQPVCCTHGRLPDISPKPGKDGSCFVYTIKKDNGCSSIAASHGITVANIEKYNKKTWGWNGCKLLDEKAQICLSNGTPPLSNIDATKYTHIYFAFANVTSNFGIDSSGAQVQFNCFKAMPGSVKRIISLGGWDFGTKPGTFNILREATKAEIKNHYEDCDSEFSTLDQLNKVRGEIPFYCVDLYIVDMEIQLLSTALDRYKDLIDNGYDEKFKTFEEYTVEQIPSQINAVMGNGHVGDFFTCEEAALRTCCSSCQFASCIGNCDNSDDCKDGYGTHEVTCPTIYKDGTDGIDWYNTVVPNVTYTLRDSDGFYEAINKDHGVGKDWIRFGDTSVRVSNGCQWAQGNIRDCQKRQDAWFWHYPQAADNIQVFNPKDVIGRSYEKSKDLLFNLKMLRAIGSLDSQLSMADLADAASLPAMTMAFAVDSMNKVVKQARSIKKREREDMIANFVGAILFFIPLAGEAVDASMAAVRSALAVVDEFYGAQDLDMAPRSWSRPHNGCVHDSPTPYAT